MRDLGSLSLRAAPRLDRKTSSDVSPRQVPGHQPPRSSPLFHWHRPREADGTPAHPAACRFALYQDLEGVEERRADSRYEAERPRMGPPGGRGR